MNIVWLRNDLRLRDNPALWHGAGAGPVTALYILSPGQWRRHGLAACKVDFILRNLVTLARDLAARGIPLRVEQVDLFSDIPALLSTLAKTLGAGAVYWNDEYPLDESQRDEATEQRLRRDGVDVHRFHDRVIAPPGAVVKNDGTAYQVFTPFKRTWLAALDQHYNGLVPLPKKHPPVKTDDRAIPATVEGFESAIAGDLWPAGEEEALSRLKYFGGNTLNRYHRRRDFPADNGTSTLSPYLAIGAVSPRQCLQVALEEGGGEGADTWISELAWRDFYQHIAHAFPRVCQYKAFKRETEAVAWRHSDGDFRAWCQGRTGVPLVDAGMRQLAATGWMHNRVRMVTAMFLSKHLLLDWRRGEAFFMAHLVDGDFPANNGGWQWSASTGTDAVPYFRVFNPFTQGKRFDPDAAYIKAFVPELRELTPNQIHSPALLARHRPETYPGLMLDLDEGRKRAIAAFRRAGTSKNGLFTG